MKKEHCCKYEGIACEPGGTTTTPFGRFRGTTTTPLIFFDCTAGFANWRAGWSVSKKIYCCRTEGVGCEDTTTTPYGYGRRRHPILTTTPQFDCEAGLPNWEYGWSLQKKKYCCETHGVGCQARTTTPFSPGGSTLPFPGRTTQPNFDCRAGLEHWELGWSEEKKRYCCEKHGFGCDGGRTTPFPPAGTTEPSTGPDFDCKVGARTWEITWSQRKQRYCCIHANIGCGKDTTTTPFATLPPSTTKIFDCHLHPGWETGWSQAQRDYCCQHHHRGCAAQTSTTPFPVETTRGDVDCEHGRDQWQQWSAHKKQICCTQVGVGCEGHATTPFPPSGTTNQMTRDPWGASIANTAQEALGHLFPRTTKSKVSPTTPFPPDGTTSGGPSPTSARPGPTTPFPPDGTTSGLIPTSARPGPTTPFAPDGTTTPMGGDDTTTPRGGTIEIMVSTNCQEALLFLDSDYCDQEVLLGSVQRTCDVRDESEQEKACKAWYGDYQGMSEADKQKNIQRCTRAMSRSVNVEKNIRHTAPANDEEKTLCFKCVIKCQRRLFFPTAEVVVRRRAMEQTFWKPDGSASHCRPIGPSGEISGLQQRKRKDVSTWTEQEWARFGAALDKLKENGTYDKYAKLFTTGMPTQDRLFMNFQQAPWFRRFLHDFETDLQVAANDCDITLPFWSACTEAGPGSLLKSKLWYPKHMGGKAQCPPGPGPSCGRPSFIINGRQCPADLDHWCVGDGVAGGWHVNPGNAQYQNGCSCVGRSPDDSLATVGSCASLLPVLRLAEDFKSLAEGIDAVRASILCGAATGEKGTLCASEVSVYDPLFWLGHAFADRLFFKWQRYHVVRNDIDTTDCYGCQMELSHYKEPLTEWLGKHDNAHKCIQLPKSNPTTCLSYEDTATP